MFGMFGYVCVYLRMFAYVCPASHIVLANWHPERLLPQHSKHAHEAGASCNRILQNVTTSPCEN
jgi:hypothetical protein